ncbi:MAG: IS630 family transposase [Patescibacteria group bacterium]
MLSFKKTKLVPANPPSEEKQQEVIEQIEELSRRENTILLFFDPCHLQHNVVNAKRWQPKGRNGTIQIKTNTGRKRINILGALNINNITTLTTLTEKRCNKETVTEFFAKIRQHYPENEIILILDNAPYNHAKYTTIFAEWYNIELFFLPPYSPNLNLIERLWKFTKKKLVHNTYHEKFQIFKQKTQEFFNNQKEYQSELKEMITKKFQILHTV